MRGIRQTHSRRLIDTVFFVLLASGRLLAAGSKHPSSLPKPAVFGPLLAADVTSREVDEVSEGSLSFGEKSHRSPQDFGVGESQNLQDSQDSKGSGIVIYIFLGMFVVGILSLVIYLKCCVRQPTRPQTPQKDYKIVMFDGSKEQVDIKMRLNDVSTGSPDIPGWDQEKDVVKAEKLIGAV